MHHTSVLLHEAITHLELKPGETVVDATVGAGGYAGEILKAIGERGTFIGIDRDSTAIERFRNFIRKEPAFEGRSIHLIHGSFSDIAVHCKDLNIQSVDKIVADLGISSMQLDDSKRGLSFQADGPLDMRMDQLQGKTAADVIATFTEAELTRIFRDYADEKFAGQIARAIVQERENSPILTTSRLRHVVTDAVPVHKRFARIDPATKVFQALRMQVNNEREELELFLSYSEQLLSKGGRCAVVSFHSGEDMIVKAFIRRMAQGCICPPELPKCVCHNKPSVKILTKKPITPTVSEVSTNPRSRSAKLRVFEKM